jgi:hypothetical protein
VAVNLALGRIFGMMHRPHKPGDDIEYERCRAIVLDSLDGRYVVRDDRPNYATSYGKGAAGA